MANLVKQPLKDIGYFFIGAIVILGGVVTGINANAALKLESSMRKSVFLNGAGVQITPIEATQNSIKGETVLKCDEVEAVASDKGNISLKKKK